MKPIVVWGILIGIVLTLAGTGYADQNALLDELDALIESEPEQTADEDGDRPVYYQLIDNADLEVTLRGSRFFDRRDRNDNDVGELYLEFKTWLESNRYALTLSGWGEVGTQDDTYQGLSRFLRDQERYRRFVELNEIYFQYTAQPFTLTVGKRVFPHPLGLLFAPAQVYHAVDFNVPVEPKTFGIWQATAEYTRADTVITAGVFPVFQDHKLPHQDSRWTPVPENQSLWFEDEFNLTGNNDSAIMSLIFWFWDILRDNGLVQGELDNQTVVFENDLPGYSASDFGYLARVKTSLGQWDLYGSYFYGPNIYPLLKIEDRGNDMAAIKLHPTVHRPAAGFTTTWRNLEFHGETVFTYSPSQEEDSYFSYIGGFSYTDDTLVAKVGIDRMQVTVDYSGEHITERQDHDGFFFSSESIRLFRNDLLARIIFEVNDDTAVHALLDFELEHHSRFQRFGGSYRIRPGLVAELFWDNFDGDERSYMGQWSHNDRVVALIKYQIK